MTNVAGVVAVSNWNNSWPSDPRTDLLDNRGQATTLDLNYGPTAWAWSIYSYHPGRDADGTYNKELLNGYLNAGMAAWNPPVTNSHITLSQIPYAVYDVYVYFSSDVAGRPGHITDGTTTYYFSTAGPASINGPNAVFIQTSDTAGTYPTANYAVFSNLTGDTLTITCQMEVPELWGGIAGFQLVQVPEPSPLWLIPGMLGWFVLKRATRR